MLVRAFLLISLVFGLNQAAQATATPALCQKIFAGDSKKSANLIPGSLQSQPRVIIISAPSGAGKSTLMGLLTSEFPNSFGFSVSTTTRAPRGTEKDGVEYHFTNVADFEERINKGEFIEYAKVHGNFYGTSRAAVEQILKSGRSVILDVDVQGAAVVRKALPGQTVSIFISPENLIVLEQRLRARKTDTEEAIQKRMKNATEELKHAPEYDTEIVNADLAAAYARFKGYLIALPPLAH